MTRQLLLMLSRSRGFRGWLALVMLLVVASAFFPPTVSAAPIVLSSQHAAAAPAALLADTSSLGRVLQFLEAKLSDRRRMIQLATIGMCIGLYILMRR